MKMKLRHIGLVAVQNITDLKRGVKREIGVGDSQFCRNHADLGRNEIVGNLIGNRNDIEVYIWLDFQVVMDWKNRKL